MKKPIDPDETAGRRLYRAHAEAQVRRDDARALHPVRLENKAAK